MNNENLKPIEKLTPFTKMIMTIGTLPSSFYASMSYYESMVWLYEYLKNQVIPTVNNNGEAVEELQTAFTTLQNWIENYFENLDVQEEINKKLDKMALDGTLTNLIKDYVDPIYEDYESRINQSINAQNQIIDGQNESIASIENKVDSVTSGSPAGVYATVLALETADPDHDKIYLVTADGKWYYYDTTETSWIAGGTYQASSFPELDALKTGFDNTNYASPAKAVNSQFEELDNLIKTDIVKTTDNIFNVPIRAYYNINNSTGVETYNTSNVNTACTTEYIEVKPSTQYYQLKNINYQASASIFEYDEDYSFISKIDNAYFTTSATARYIKVKFNKSNSAEEIPIKLNNNYMIYETNITADYSKLPFIPNYEVKNIGKDTVNNYSIKNKGISIEKLDFINYDNSINKINFYRFIPLSNLEPSSGLFTINETNINSCANDTYIPVNPETNYSFNCKAPYTPTVYFYWYTEDKEFISYDSGVTNESPASANFLRLKLVNTGHGVELANETNHIILSATDNPIEYTQAYSFSTDIVPTDKEEETIKSIINEKREDFIKLNKTKKLLNFAMCTDTHLYDKTGDQSGLLDIKVVNEIGKENWIDFAVHGGDIFNAYLVGSETGSQGITHEVAMQRIDDALSGFKDIKVPIYIARGNHDLNNKYKPGYPDDQTIDTSQMITNSEFYMLAQHNFAQNVDNQFELNFYKDYNDLKIRVITLDTFCNLSGSSNFTHDVLNWLANTALKVENDYQAIIIAHSVEGTAGTILQNLINAFKTGGSYTNATLSVSVDYSEQGSRKFIGCLCGHSHAESDSSSLGFWTITSGTSYLKTNPDIDQDIYASIFTIDPDNHLLYKQKVGANGYNKVYDYVNLTSEDL